MFLIFAHFSRLSQFGTTSMTGNFRLSPIITAWLDVLVRLDRVLDRLRRDVLAARGDDDVLLAIGDADEAVLDDADVAGLEPALGVDRVARRVGLVVVALHDVRAARQDLAVLRDLHLDAVDRLSDRADAEVRPAC